MTSRLHIGLITTHLKDSYHFPIWKAIAQKAVEADINLSLFVEGTNDRAYNTSSPGNAIYDLINPTNLDGLLIITGPFSCHLSPDTLKEFCYKYKSIPLVSIGNKIPGIPTVGMENTSGAYAQMKHILETHNLTRFAFLTGPSLNQDSLERLKGYYQALEEHHIPVNKEYVLEGNYCYHKSRDIITQIIAEKKMDFDVLICANDAMAISAIETFTQHGIRVPEDKKVTGFDDIITARYINPPVTTVKQPLREAGEKAIEMLLELIGGTSAPADIKLPTRVIIRQSCGCTSYALNQIGLSFTPPQQHPAGNETVFDTGSFQGYIIQSLSIPPQKKKLFSRWLTLFISNFNAYLADDKQTGTIIHSFTKLVFEDLHSAENEAFWRQLLSCMRTYLLVHKAYQNHNKKIILLFQKLHIHFNELSLRINTCEALRYFAEVEDINLLNYNHISTFNMDELMKNIASELNRLKINNCYIIEYQGKVKPEQIYKYSLPARSRILYSFINDKQLPLEEDKRVFPTREILPREQRPAGRFTFITLPLYSDANIFGYIIYALSDCHPSFYTLFQSAISNAITGLRYITELQRTKIIAESTNKIKNEFMAKMNHDIRTPMNSILGFTELLLEEVQEPEVKEKLKTVHRAGCSLLNIINEMMDFHKEAFFLSLFFEKIKKMFSLKATQKDLTFTLNIRDNLPEKINANEQRLYQVIIKLIGNALKFTEKGSVELQASLENEMVVIRVKDTGIGIPPAKLTRIFSPFAQADTSTAEEDGCTGWGLLISRRMIEQMNGTLKARSTPGKGSCFTITLPLHTSKTGKKEGRDIKQPLLPEEIPLHPKGDKPVTGYTILIAEDEELNRKLYAALLAKMQIPYDFAENGKETLSKLKAKHYDLLLLDMQMPVMNGLETIRRIREDKEMAGLVVIAVTAHALKKDEHKYLQAGCNDYLSKPLNKNLFIKKICTCMGRPETESGKKEAAKTHVNGATPPQTSPPLPANLLLDRTQLSQLDHCLTKLTRCRKIFDEEIIKEVAETLLTLSPDPYFHTVWKLLKRAAENYELDILIGIIESLQQAKTNSNGKSGVRS